MILWRESQIGGLTKTNIGPNQSTSQNQWNVDYEKKEWNRSIHFDDLRASRAIEGEQRNEQARNAECECNEVQGFGMLAYVKE